jgi:hypothetical protein
MMTLMTLNTRARPRLTCPNTPATTLYERLIRNASYKTRVRVKIYRTRVLYFARLMVERRHWWNAS